VKPTLSLFSLFSCLRIIVIFQEWATPEDYLHSCKYWDSSLRVNSEATPVSAEFTCFVSVGRVALDATSKQIEHSGPSHTIIHCTNEEDQVSLVIHISMVLQEPCSANMVKK